MGLPPIFYLKEVHMFESKIELTLAERIARDIKRDLLPKIGEADIVVAGTAWDEIHINVKVAPNIPRSDVEHYLDAWVARVTPRDLQYDIEQAWE